MTKKKKQAPKLAMFCFGLCAQDNKELPCLSVTPWHRSSASLWLSLGIKRTRLHLENSLWCFVPFSGWILHLFWHFYALELPQRHKSLNWHRGLCIISRFHCTVSVPDTRRCTFYICVCWKNINNWWAGHESWLVVGEIVVGNAVAKV